MTDEDPRLKRLRFRAWHRGFVEADLILGPFVDRYGTYFLASTSGVAPDQGATDSSPGGCSLTENTDLDYYFCESRGEDLDAVFRQIASQVAQRSRLLNF